MSLSDRSCTTHEFSIEDESQVLRCVKCGTDEANAEIQSLNKQLKVAEQLNKQLQTRCELYEEALKRYGTHGDQCDKIANGINGDCFCGWNLTEEALQSGASKEGTRECEHGVKAVSIFPCNRCIG